MKVQTLIWPAIGFAVLLLAAALGGAPALGAEPPEPAALFEETQLMFIGEELYTVTIASRKAEPLSRAPAAVTVLQGAELKKYRTLAEALVRVPGFFVDRTELKERIYLRGIPDSFLVMMDGVPFSSDASTIDYPRGMDLSLDYIDKIEIIRGPGSALWGPDAFSGIINLVTRKGRDLQGAEITGEAGSHETYGTSGQAGFAREGWDGYLFSSYAETHGFEDDVPGSRERKRDHYGEFYGRLSYKDLFEVSGRYSNYRDFYTVPFYLLQGSETRSFSFVQATLNKSFETAALSLQGWYQYFDSLDDYDRSRYEQRNRQYGLETKYDQTLFGNNFATLGASFRYNDGSSTRYSDRYQSFSYFPNYDTRLYSLYFQDKWKITDNLETTVGVRYDNHSEYNASTSPRIGVNYIFWDYFSLKLLYGRAFRTPSLAVVIEEPGLDPERIDSYEVGLGYHYRNIFNFTVNYFYNELDDLIQRNALGNITNTGDEIIKGVEVAVQWRPFDWLSLYANYSHLFGDRQKGTKATTEIPSEEDPNQSVDATIESFLTVAPDNVANVGFDISFLQHFRLNVEMNYIDRRKLVTGITDTGTAGRRNLPSRAVFDVNLFVNDLPLKNLEMVLMVNNIFDKDYRTRGVYGTVDGEGSSVYCIMRYRF